MHRRQLLRALAAASGAPLGAMLLRPGPAAARALRLDDGTSAVRTFAGIGLTAVPRIVLDPGHGGAYVGGSAVDDNGNLVQEKDLTLTIARRAALLLRRDGCKVVLTRTEDVAVATGTVYDDLLGRIDRANAVGADAFLSIHVNEFPDDPSVRGIATFFCAARPFADQNRALAAAVQDQAIGAMRELDLEPPNGGAVDEARLDGPGHLVVLGPPDANQPRATEMPGALTELLYLSNPTELAALVRDDVLNALAHGVARGIEQFVGM